MFTFFAVFRQANKPERALIAHEKALDWQELFELVSQQELPTSDIAYRVAGTYPFVDPLYDAHGLTRGADVKEAVLGRGYCLARLCR